MTYDNDAAANFYEDGRRESEMLQYNDMVLKEVAVFDPIVAGLEELKATALGLVVASPEDMVSYQQVKSFRNSKLVKLRTTVEAKRKEIKKFYLDAGDAIDAKAKEVTKKIQEIEGICKKQESIVDDYQEQLKRRIEAERKERLRSRIEALQAVRGVLDSTQLEAMSDEEFQKHLAVESARFNAEKHHQEMQLAEMARLKAALELEAKAREQERRKVEEAQREVARVQALEIARQKAILEEQARLQAIENENKAREETARKAAQAKLLEEAKDKELAEKVIKTFDTLEKAQAEIIRCYKAMDRGCK